MGHLEFDPPKKKAFGIDPKAFGPFSKFPFAGITRFRFVRYILRFFRTTLFLIKN